MKLRKIYTNLLFKVFCGILLGILLGWLVLKGWFPQWIYRIVLTFKGLFGSFLGFAIPLIIMGLVMPSISKLGKSAGRLLLITVGIAYSFTLFSGFSTYFASEAIFPSLLENQHIKPMGDEQVLTPFFSIQMPPIADVMTALVLSFIMGIGLSLKEKSVLSGVIEEFGEIVSWLIAKAIIPVLPYYIMAIFAEITFGGKVVSVIEVFFKLIVVLFVMHILLINYTVPNCRRNCREESIQITYNHVASLCYSLGYPILRSDYSNHPTTSHKDGGIASYCRFCHSTVCYYTSFGKHHENHRLCYGFDAFGRYAF